MTDLFNHAESQRLKSIGMEQAANGYGAYDWLSQAQSIAKMLSAKFGEVTVDEVLKLCPRPTTVSPNATGSLFNGKGWQSLGFVPTSNVRGRGRMIRRWFYRE